MPERTPEEVFGHHADALIKGDLDELLADYTDDAMMITPSGTKRGKAGVREAFDEILRIVPSANWEVPIAVFADDLLFIEWTAKTPTASLLDGVDTFAFRNGMIRAQTVRYRVSQQ